MQQETSSRISSRSRITWLAVLMMALVLTLGLVQVSNASEPRTTPGYLLMVDGAEVAGGETEEELNAMVRQVVDSYRTEYTVSAEPVNLVEVVAGEVSEALPQKEALASAVTEALDVQVKDEITYRSSTYAETEFIMDDTLYEDQVVREEGVAGEEQFVSHVTRMNDEIRFTKETGTVTVAEPQPAVIRRGTRVRPDYVWPAHGTMTSPFGSRGGKMHKGIDIAGGVGTNIYATRGGRVVYAGWNSGGYGNLVIIDHENGMMSYYGHNSSLLVSPGDYVSQGQHIAEMGSTGRSSGSHCHFELRKGSYSGIGSGSPVNPMKYLGR